jgi:DNA polymerase III subunit delta'
VSGFKSIIGQEHSIRFLTILLQKGIIPNALLFTGPEGVGKKMAAFSFAMAANCAGINKSSKKKSDLNAEYGSFPTEPCGTCKNCRLFNTGGHPDFIWIDPDGQVTKIVQVRELRQLISMKPFGARLRVVVLSKAHTLNQEASNALLKVLEEPPNRTVLILITPRISDLLPTIVSRCQHIRFHPIPVKLLAATLEQNHAMDQKESEFIAAMANGSFSRALALKNTDWIFRRDWIIKETEKMHTASVAVVLALAEKMAKSKDKESTQDLLEMIKTWYRDLVIAGYCPDKIINKDLMANIRNISRRYHQNTLLNRISAVQKAQKEIDANVNPRLVLENLFLTLADTSRDND